MARYIHTPHPHIARRAAAGPVRVSDQHQVGTAAERFNTRLALAATKVVGSMWCAYAFAGLALSGLPAAIAGGVGPIVQWVAQTFLQLVLLSVIMVGQNVQAAAADKRSEATYDDVTAALHEQGELQRHLLAQDDHLAQQDGVLGALADELAELRTRIRR